MYFFFFKDKLLIPTPLSTQNFPNCSAEFLSVSSALANFDAIPAPFLPLNLCPIESYTEPDQTPVRLFDLPTAIATSIPNARFLSLRDIFHQESPHLYAYAQRAFQILHWRRSYRFCPSCSSPLIRKKSPERAMQCPSCRLDFFPRINPAVIAAISFQGKILLAERSGPNGSFYSLIAGFVEPGETIEDAMRREIREEVGLELSSLSYVSSQPWPFPSCLMLGFEATASSPNIHPDGVEIKIANWFAPDSLPSNLPQKLSIAAFLIERWRKNTLSSSL